MPKKKLIAFAALLLSAAIMLSACAAGRVNPTVINIWHYYNGPQKQAFDEIVLRFNETEGAKNSIVIVAMANGSVDELKQTVIDSVEKRVGTEPIPELFAAYADTAYEIYLRGALADIGAYFTQEEQSLYVSDYLYEGGLPEHKILVFPIAKSTEVLTLNKTDWEVFKAVSGVSESDLLTWEGVTETAKIYYEWTDSLTPDTEGDGKAFYGRDAMANYVLVGAYQLGQSLFTVDESGSVQVNLDKTAMRRIWDNYYVPYINGYFAAYGRFRSDDMKTGDLIAYVGSTSGAAYFPSAITRADGSSYSIECMILPLPGFEGTQPAAIQQGAGLAMTKTTEEKEKAAALFLKWFTLPENNLEFALASGYMPVTVVASDWEYVEKYAAENEVDVPAPVEQTLKVSFGMTSRYELYTSAAFKNSNGARDIMNRALSDKAAADLAAIEALVNGGTPKAEAVARYDTGANFEEWFVQLESQFGAFK